MTTLTEKVLEHLADHTNVSKIEQSNTIADDIVVIRHPNPDQPYSIAIAADLDGDDEIDGIVYTLLQPEPGADFVAWSRMRYIDGRGHLGDVVFEVRRWLENSDFTPDLSEFPVSHTTTQIADPYGNYKEQTA